jgi:hypothetical protein
MARRENPNEEEAANAGRRSELNPGCVVPFVIIISGIVGTFAVLTHFV